MIMRSVRIIEVFGYNLGVWIIEVSLCDVFASVRFEHDATPSWI